MSVSRREFLVAVPAALAFVRRSPQSPGGSERSVAARLGEALPSRPAIEGLLPPVVSFHLDRPYLDLTGLEKPYVPPAGMRSGAALAALSEEEVLGRFYGFI